MGLFESLWITGSAEGDAWAAAGEVVDRGTSATVGVGGILGGLVLSGASEGASLLNDAALTFGFKTEEEAADAEELLTQTQEFGKGAAASGAMGILNAVTDPIDPVARLDEADNFWDVFFQDSAENVGNITTSGTVLADISRTGETPTAQELEARRATVEEWEDEILGAVFVGLPFAMFPKLRVLLAAASPAIISIVSNSIQTGVGLGADVMQTILTGLGIALDDNDTIIVEKEVEETPIVESTESTDEGVIEDEQTELVVEQEIEDPVEEEEGIQFFSTMDLDQSNKFVDREINY